MANIFQIAVERLSELGFYNFFLPFILFTTLFYAVLRKTQVLGESPLIHGIISVAVGLFVFGAPAIAGVNLAESLTAFVTQAAIIILVFVVGFLVISFFYPNVTEKLTEIFPKPGPGGWMVWSILGIAVVLGLFPFLKNSLGKAFEGIKIPGDLLTMVVVIVVVLVVFLIVTVSRGIEK